EHDGAGDGQHAAEIALDQLHGGGGEVDVVGRARALIVRHTDGLAAAGAAEDLVHGVLALALWAVDNRRADHDRPPVLLDGAAFAFELAPGVDRLRVDGIVLRVGAGGAIEDVFGREVG